MRLTILLLVLTILGPPSIAHSQETGNPARLHLTGSVKTSLIGPVFNRVACDEAGNIYVRQVSNSTGDAVMGRQPLMKIKRDGTLAGAFKIAGVSPDLLVQDFFVSSEDDVYLLALSTGSQAGTLYVTRFAGNGSLRSSTQIDSAERFVPSSLMAVFKSGEILLSGLRGNRQHMPYTGVFTADGRLIKRIFEPEDEDLRQRAERGDERVLATSAGGSGNAAVDFGSAVMASDGNAYLMRSTAPVLIYAISSRGEVVRKLRVDTGDPSLVGDGLQSGAGGRLAVSFSRQGGGGEGVVIVDLNGKPLATYSIAPGEPSGDLGCYMPPKLTFVSLDKPDDPLYLNSLGPN
jgi:hypothetical protein